ncbi:MAG: hypothetical protein J5855_02040 [Mailhella sp.]|nr:hypothetical protein [Mailhella sp.]
MKTLNAILSASTLAILPSFSAFADIPSPPPPLKTAQAVSDPGMLPVLAVAVVIMASAILIYKLKQRGK